MNSESVQPGIEVSADALAGLKVLDFSWVGVGPITARHLADFGATVVRVESATRPDTLRLAPPFRDGAAGLDRSAFGAAYNANKLGISLNLRKPRARELALRLVEWADIVTDSMTPGSLARLSLGYEQLRQLKPSLVMFSTTQQGQTGPYANFGGYGQHGASVAGFVDLTGWPDREPAGPFGAYTDFIAPWFLLTALLAALDHRDRTGEGQYLDESQTEAGIQLLGPALLDWTANGHLRTRRGNEDDEYFPHGAFRCRDDDTAAGPADRWCAVAVTDAEEWYSLCGVLGRTDWSSDDALETASGRRAIGGDIDAAIEGWTRSRTPHEAMLKLQAAGVPAGAVQTCEELFEDPQLRERGHFWFLDHTVIGSHAYDAPAFKLSRTPARPVRAGPVLGQHTHEVCRDILGLSDAAITELVADGALE
ncbi:MAG: CaiB/BaiF CoA transferase family protein [Dehalococcoidia bacterium]